MKLRKQIMKLGKITTAIGGFSLYGKIAEQEKNGYWKTKYKTVYFTSEDINKLRKLKIGYQYFGKYWA